MEWANNKETIIRSQIDGQRLADTCTMDISASAGLCDY